MRSYSSILNLGHKAVADLFTDDVIVECKIDGSQLSFGIIDGELQMRSKGAQINLVAPEGMFLKAIESVKARQHLLTPGFTYRGEYLQKPKHNTLAYERTPRDYIIIWDIDAGMESYMQPEEKAAEAARIGLECVPLFFRGRITDLTTLRDYLHRQSVLGGTKVEGVVIKPAAYDKFGADKKLLCAKLVSEEFKEVHGQTWTKEHKTPGQGDIIAMLASKYNTQARWQKARQHLMEAGELIGDMRDMPKLLAEVPRDVKKECADEIREQLWEWAWPQLKRGLSRGLAEWLKEKLAKEQFEQGGAQ